MIDPERSSDAARIALTARIARDGHRRRRARFRGWVVEILALAFIAAGAFAQLPTTARGLEPLVMIASIAALAAAVLAREIALRPRFEPARVTLEGGRLRAETSKKALDWAVADLTDGWLESPHQLRLWHRSGEGLLLTDLEAEVGPRLLKQLSLDPEARAASFATESSVKVEAPALDVGAAWGAVGLGLVPFLLTNADGRALQGLPAVATLAAALFLAIPACLLLLHLRSARQIVVGTDGLILAGSWRRRFLPHDRILDIRVDPYLHLVTHDEVIPLGSRFRDKTERDNDHALAHRVREAMAARREAAARIDVTALARGTRDAQAWRAEVVGRARGVSTYRRDAWAPQDLVAIASDASLPLDVRVGATLAAAGAGDDTIRQQLRINARASAQDHLRAALEAAAEGEILEAELALAERAQAATARV
ncbi:MAG: hypothetical protein R3B72_08690 [Polyangiaceae bacterium]